MRPLTLHSIGFSVAARRPGVGPARRGLARVLLGAAVLGLSVLSPGKSVSPLLLGDADQVRTLDQSLNLQNRPLALEELISLSRLLSDPADQLAWLEKQLTDEQLKNETLAVGVGERLKALEEKWPNFKENKAAVAARDRLRGKIKPKDPPPVNAPIAQELNPQQLKTRLTQEKGNLKTLSAADQFKLLARGAALNDLDLPSSLARDWDAGRAEENRVYACPQIVMNTLVKNTTDGSFVLLEPWSLLNYQRCVGDAANRVSDAAVKNAARIADALLDRALGVTAENDTSAAWGGIAGQMETENLWTWAVLARVLQAAAAPDAGERRNAVAQARKYFDDHLGQVAESNTGLVRFIQDALTRLGNDQLTAAGRIPLSHNFRQQALAKRGEAETAFQAAWGRKDLREAFRQMQLAKAAEIGWANPPVAELDDMPRLLPSGENPTTKKRFPNVNLYLEVFTIGNTHYGIALYSNSLTIANTNEFVTDSFESSAGLEGMVAAAFQKAFSGRRDAFAGKVIIAPDRENRLLNWNGLSLNGKPPSNWAVEKGWIAYMPTAAALKENSGWTLGQALRLWHQSATSPSALDYWGDRGGPKAITNILGGTSPLKSRPYVIYLGGKCPAGWSVDNLHDDKLKTDPVLPLFVSLK